MIAQGPSIGPRDWSRGALKGDAYVLGSIGFLVLREGTFVLYPILSTFAGAFQEFDGSFTATGIARNTGDPQI